MLTIAEDVRASFLFIRDLNCHHQEWLGFTTTIGAGVISLALLLHPVVISW